MNIKTVEYDFDIGDSVYLIPLQTRGIISALYYDQEGPQYRVRFWDNSCVKFEYLLPSELGK